MTSQRSASASWRTNPQRPPRFQPCLQPDTTCSLTLDEQAEPGTVVAQLERTPSVWHSSHNLAKPVRVGSVRGEPVSEKAAGSLNRSFPVRCATPRKPDDQAPRGEGPRSLPRLGTVLDHTAPPRVR